MDIMDLIGGQQDDPQAKEAESKRLAQLASFASRLTAKRSEAVNARKQSGIERIWKEDDDYYMGIDEANRGESTLKPASMNGRLTSSRNGPASHKSNVFVNITQPYVDAASARVADMALPTTDKPFGIKPTPMPDVIEASKNHDEMMPGGQYTVGQASQAFLDIATEKAEKAETQIWDWLCESRWHSEVRKVIEQASRIGTGCLKGPTPVKRKKRAMNKIDDGTIALILEEEIKPESKAISVWNLFPDPSCGASIHNGSYIFERESINARQLRDLKGTGYIDSEIDEVLKEGPGKINVGGRDKFREQAEESDMYEIWYFYGTADKEDLEAAGCPCDKEAYIPVVISMVNDRIIKASMSVLDSGSFPYDVMVWQRSDDHWSGIGVARQVRTAQRIINAAARNMLDNAGVSAGPQLIMRTGVISPADGEWSVTPLKIWTVDEDADIQNVNSAITSIAIPSMQQELDAIIKMALDFAERSTSMPIMLQGQQGSATETVGGMTMLQNNSNTVLRRIAKIYDDDLIEPHILRYYEWLMLYGEEEAKGDFNVIAEGSSALYERDAANQAIMQLIQLSGNPQFGLNPEKIMTEVLKMNKITPARVSYSDEEKEQMKQQQGQQQADPKIEAQKEIANIKIQGEMEKAKLLQSGDMEKAKLVQSSDMAELERKNQAMQAEFNFKMQMLQAEHQHQLQLKELDYKIEMMRLSSSQQISLDSIKASLASDAMKLKTQTKLSEMDLAHKQALIPPTEPVGRAQDGHSFQQ